MPHQFLNQPAFGGRQFLQGELHILRRSVARVVGDRLKDEASPRALDALYDLASGGMFCTQGGGDADEHRCSPALLRALQAQVRKGERAALRALSTHPTEEVIAFLLGQLDSVREPARRDELAAALRGLTQVGITSADPTLWRAQLTPLQDSVKRQLARQAHDDARRVAERLARGQRRLDELGH